MNQKPHETQLIEAIHAFDTAAYVESYEFRGDGGDYVPTGPEQELLTDAIEGVLYALEQAVPQLSKKP